MQQTETDISKSFIARAVRPRVLNSGKLVIHGGQSVIDCVVRNMSEDGARVRITIPTMLPNTVELLVVKNDMIYPAEVRWNRNSEAGLRFTGPGKLTARRY